MSYKNIFKDKTILITGGTGFLGRALTKELLKFSPQSIRLLSRDEVKHHKMQEMFDYNSKLRNFIGDVRDYARLLRAMEGTDIVIHAAALKRLDILEYNVQESIKTNIIGTLNVANACLEKNVEKAIFISTDKACSPVNTYGACKFVSERIFIENNYSKGSKKTIFSCVRYGNVLESTGSVIPFFSQKIKGKDEIPITDTRMTRFIISPEQAVELIFKALKHAVGGEVFVPKLPAFKILDLVDILKEKFQSEVDTKLVGLRPGEKIHELMINQTEIPRTYDFNDVFVITSSIHKHITVGTAIYKLEGTLLDENKFSEYSSKDAVISRKDVKDLFEKLGLL